MKRMAAFIDLFRKGVRLKDPAGLKNVTVWSGVLAAIVSLLHTYDIPVSWLTPELIEKFAGVLVSIFGAFVASSTLVTTRKIGLPGLTPKPMPAPEGVNSHAWDELAPVINSELAPSDANRFSQVRKLNSKLVNVVAKSAGQSFSNVELILRIPGYVAATRPGWIKERGYIIKLDDDAKHDAGEFSKFWLHDSLPAVTVPWSPSDEDMRANDWIIIDDHAEGSQEYLFPERPDMGCQVQLRNHNGQMVLEKDWCITPAGVVQPLQAEQAVIEFPLPVKYSRKAKALEVLLKNANVKSFLNMVRFAEGTSKPEHYFVQFNYVPFTDISDKPKKVIEANGYRSSAAGAYQIINRTWEDIQRDLDLPDFSPHSQDIAALYLIEREGQIKNVVNGQVMDAIKGVSGVWASLPGNSYGQPTKPLNKLVNVYHDSLMGEIA